jgi:DNA-binding phage protein
MYRLDRDIPRAKIERRKKAKQELVQLAQERQELQAALAANRSKLHRALPEAREAGFGVSDLARFTGMTRRAIYDALETSGAAPVAAGRPPDARKEKNAERQAGP